VNCRCVRNRSFAEIAPEWNPYRETAIALHLWTERISPRAIAIHSDPPFVVVAFAGCHGCGERELTLSGRELLFRTWYRFTHSIALAVQSRPAPADAS
jgi:hypothetical protein